jgi:Tol biopolymer transport system component
MTEVCVGDLERNTLSRLTRSQNDSYAPIWSPDGERVAFNNRDSGTEDIYVQVESGTRPKEKLWDARSVDATLADWSRDGRFLLFDGVPRPGGPHREIWLYDMDTRTAESLLRDDFDMLTPCLSPDGHLLAYVSDESGRNEIYLRSFPDLDRKWQVSTSGGRLPHWRSDGSELLFIAGAEGDLAFCVVSIASAQATLGIGVPTRLFAIAPDHLEIVPTAEHSRFLAVVQPAAPREPLLRVVLGWRAGM